MSRAPSRHPAVPMAAPHLLVSRALVPSRAVVDTAPEREHFWAALLRAWGVSGPRAKSASFHPGANPCSLARADLAKLKAGTNVVALKSDGVRYVLFLTRRPGTQAPVALMIDRARAMYEVEVVAQEEYFAEGTVLEGELVWRHPDEAAMLYLVFDAVLVRGERVTHLPFAERLAKAVQCVRWSEELAALPPDDLEARVAETDSLALVQFDPPIAMRAKHFVAQEHAARVWRDRAEAAHRVDGLILHCAGAPYKCGTATGAVYKWKECHTVDLRGPPPLQAADGPVGEALLGRRVEVLPSRVAVPDGEIAEYHVDVDAATVRLLAMRTRPDKRAPNGRRVVEATVRDALEALTPDDL